MTGTETLVLLFVIFVLATFVGVEVIKKVPPTLHTPLMSGSNAISGITVVGAMVIAGMGESTTGLVLGTFAVALAMINVVGGFLVTDRMLSMFRKDRKEQGPAARPAASAAKDGKAAQGGR